MEKNQFHMDSVFIRFQWNYSLGQVKLFPICCVKDQSTPEPCPFSFCIIYVEDWPSCELFSLNLGKEIIPFPFV